MAECIRCRERVKDWNGSDPKCAFPEGVFVSENWNCATMNDLREITEDPPTWYGWNKRECDHSFGLIPVTDSLKGWSIFIALSWYKSRGRTGQAWVFCEDQEPQRLTYDEAENSISLIKHGKKYQPLIKES